MRKEILVAIVFGLMIGLVVAFGAWRLNPAKEEEQPSSVISQDEEIQENITPPPFDTITLTTLEDFDVITTSPFTISGTVKPNTKLFISGENKDHLITAEADGSFSQEVDFKTGINQIIIGNQDPEGNVNTKNLRLVYSREFASVIEGAEENEATPSSDTVLDKVKQKVESLRKNPKAIVGSVTDKTEDSLQIKDLNEKIELISISDDSTFSKVSGSSTSIKFSDIGIGDFIVAIGFANGNGVLDAKRLLLADAPEEPKRKIYFAKISSVSRKEIVIAESSGSELKLTFPRTWAGPNVSDLETDMNVGIVSNDQEVRTIEIISEE